MSFNRRLILGFFGRGPSLLIALAGVPSVWADPDMPTQADVILSFWLGLHGLSSRGFTLGGPDAHRHAVPRHRPPDRAFSV